MTRILAALMLLAGAAQAQDWRAMGGAEIATALTDRGLNYESATQRFFASGGTLYNAGQDSWGYWTVRGDQYCSQWPPTDGWDCYDMTTDGVAVRFIASDGSMTEGVFLQ